MYKQRSFYVTQTSATSAASSSPVAAVALAMTVAVAVAAFTTCCDLGSRMHLAPAHSYT